MDLTLYSILGVPPGATDDDLRAGYEDRLAALDREQATASPTAVESIRAARTQLEEAWEILSDPVLRLQYDLMAAATHPGGPAPDVPVPDPPPAPPAGVHHELPASPDGPPVQPLLHHLPPPPPPGTAHDPSDPRRPPSSSECQLCGSAPAAAVTLRREVGIVLVRQSHVLDGVYCRSCGISLFREMTDKTMVRGWWGFISFFVNWFTIARNVAARVALGHLDEPEPNPDVRASLPEPLVTGRPVLLRLGPLVTVALIVGVVVLFAMDDGRDPVPSDAVGTCVELESDQSEIIGDVSCEDPHDAVITQVVDLDEPCGPDEIRFEGDDLADALCLQLA